MAHITSIHRVIWSSFSPTKRFRCILFWEKQMIHANIEYKRKTQVRREKIYICVCDMSPQDLFAHLYNRKPYSSYCIGYEIFTNQRPCEVWKWNVQIFLSSLFFSKQKLRPAYYSEYIHVLVYPNDTEMILKWVLYTHDTEMILKWVLYTHDTEMILHIIILLLWCCSWRKTSVWGKVNKYLAVQKLFGLAYFC